MCKSSEMKRGPKGEIPLLAESSELTDKQLEQVSGGGWLGDQSYQVGDTVMFPCSTTDAGMVTWTCIEGSKTLRTIWKYRKLYNEVQSTWKCSQCGEVWYFNDLYGWSKA